MVDDKSCTQGGCGITTRDCTGCGFNEAEAERRKKIPLKVGADGLRYKNIREEVKSDGERNSDAS